ncbi:hypothetical protein EMIT07CA2_20480 [Brevibacillus sp. IT-7CA2]
MFLISVSYRDFPLSEKSGPFFTVFHYSKKESSSPSFFNGNGKKAKRYTTFLPKVQRGPGKRETDLLNPINSVQEVNAIALTGGSAYGLDAASGVMRYMEEQGQGYNVGVGVVLPIPAAVIFDLSIGGAKHKREWANIMRHWIRY